MMRPSSGLLWSPWFRCGAARSAVVFLLAALAAVPLPCRTQPCAHAWRRIIADNFLDAWWRDLHATLGTQQFVDGRIHRILA